MITICPPCAIEPARVVRCVAVDPLHDPAWDDEVRCQTDQTVFHRAAWARVLTESYGHRPCYLRVTVDGSDAALVPLMEVRSPVTGRRGVSLPFADFAGPLWLDRENPAWVYQALASHAEDRHWHHLDLRGGPSPHPNGCGFTTYHCHRLDLSPGTAPLERALHENTRRSIAKARDRGVVTTIGRSARDMVTYYHLHTLTRRRHGLPPQPMAFFKAIQNHLISQGDGFIVTARIDGKPAAGAVFLKSERRAIFKFGASDRKHWRACPNHQVIWSGIRELVDEGCLTLDFGRTDITDTGLMRFKRSWGAKASTIAYHRYHTASRGWLMPTGHHSTHASALLRHLPLVLNRLAGGLIYPHLD